MSPFLSYSSYGGGASGKLVSGSSGAAGWQILMMTDRTKADSNWNSSTPEGTNRTNRMGNTGTSTWTTITAVSTGANNRTEFGDGDGLYDAFFNQYSISKVALCSGALSGDLEPGNFARYMVYDLVATTPSDKSMYDIIKDLDTYNRTQAQWQNNDTVFGSDSVTNFVAGNAKSGSRSATSGHFLAQGGSSPDSFCIWGVNRDSDNDTQVLCAYSGDLQSGKSDSWRGSNPAQSFWSYWGNDWHSNTQTQTISQGRQSYPGVNTDSTAYRSAGGEQMGIYLLAYTA